MNPRLVPPEDKSDSDSPIDEVLLSELPENNEPIDDAELDAMIAKFNSDQSRAEKQAKLIDQCTRTTRRILKRFTLLVAAEEDAANVRYEIHVKRCMVHLKKTTENVILGIKAAAKDLAEFAADYKPQKKFEDLQLPLIDDSDVRNLSGYFEYALRGFNSNPIQALQFLSTIFVIFCASLETRSEEILHSAFEEDKIAHFLNGLKKIHEDVHNYIDQIHKEIKKNSTTLNIRIEQENRQFKMFYPSKKAELTTLKIQLGRKIASAEKYVSEKIVDSINLKLILAQFSVLNEELNKTNSIQVCMELDNRTNQCLEKNLGKSIAKSFKK